MELGYAAFMSEKEAAERAASGPKPTKVLREVHETKWRPPPALYEKVLSAAKVAEAEAEIETSAKGTISANAEVNFAVESFITTLEARFGPLPHHKDAAAIKKYARAKKNAHVEDCPKCGQPVVVKK